MLLVCLFVVSFTVVQGDISPQVTTSDGVLRGRYLLSRNGRDYTAFTRIPFAKPPIRSLRFQPPQPSEPWSGVLSATEETPLCYQSGPLGYIGLEDCLYLNIYTPKINASLPVMVYIYGGGWRNGSPGPPVASRFFMDEDVVLVMPNYRLGPFGFLSTEDEVIPGNMGLKDMALALEWTEKNIKYFGGNSKQITAFGLSAGGASTHYLCSALRTRALLKGCISESGVGGSFWSLSTPGLARTNAFKVANSVSCFGDGLLECLQSKPAEDILKTENMLKIWTGEPLIIYGPVLERKGDEALITEWPTDSSFPWLTGITSAEGILKSGGLALFYPNQSYVDEFYANKVEILIRMLKLNEAKRDSAMKVYDRFFQDNGFLEGMEKLYSEALFIQPVLKALKSHSGPKYFFVFDYTEGPKVWEIYTKRKVNITYSGASHGDNIFYFFDTRYLPGFVEPEPKHVQLSQNLIRLWVNFAKYQNPSPEGNPDWRQFGESNNYFYIGNSGFSMKEYKNVYEVLEFWKAIYQ